MENEITIAAYIRSENKSNEEIKKQKDQLKEYCDKEKYEIYKFYIDKGYSGDNLDRPSYKEMIKDMGQYKFDLIIATKFKVLGNENSNIPLLFCGELEEWNFYIKTLDGMIECEISSNQTLMFPEIWDENY